MRKLTIIILIVFLATAGTAQAYSFSEWFNGFLQPREEIQADDVLVVDDPSGILGVTQRSLPMWKASTTPYTSITPRVHGRDIYAPYSNATTSGLTILGTGIWFSSFDCTGNTNGGALTVSATGLITCSDDDGGGGAGGLHVDGGGFVYPQTGDYHASPYYTATSTTATSTFAGGLTVDTTDFVVDPDANTITFDDGLFWDGANDRLSFLNEENDITVNGVTIGVTQLIHGTDDITVELGLHQHSNTPTQGSIFDCSRTRGTEGTELEVQDNDMLCSMIALGYDGTDNDFLQASGYFMQVGGVVANDVMYGDHFWSTNNGGVVLTERMRLLANGNFGIGTSSPYAKLSVVGETVSEYFTATSTIATSTFSGGMSVQFIEGVSASEVSIALGSGSPTVDQMQEYLDNTGSSGFYEGGAITDIGSGNVSVGSGAGEIRTTADSTAPLLSFTWNASSTIAIASDTTQYIFVDDDGLITISTNEFLEAEDNIIIGLATNEGGVIESTFNLGVRLDESIGQAGRYIRRVQGIVRDQRKGGLVFGQSGDANRDVTLSAGTLWWGRTEYPISAFDTSGADTFDTYSAGGKESSTASQWDNQQYDNAGTLTTMTNNRWAVLWFYLEPNDKVIMVYGRNQYNSEADARDEGIPASSLPSRITSSGVVIARYVFQKGSNVADIDIVDSEFNTAGITDHGSLSGLSDDDHTQYILVDGTRAFTGDQSLGGNDLTNIGGATSTSFFSTTASSTNLSVGSVFNFLGTAITNVSTWFNGLFDTQFATKDTDDLTEGATNLYQLTEEEVEDFVGGMLGGTETHIAVTYQDGTNDIDFVVDDNLSSYTDDLTHTEDQVGTLTTGDLCINDGTDVQCTVNTAGELETALDGINVLLETEIDASSEMIALMDDETGTGAMCFATSPVFTTDISIGSAGVKISDDGDGAITFLGLGNGTDENLIWNFDDTANQVVVTSGTGVATTTFTGIDLRYDNFHLTGGATSTATNGIDLAGGCFSINGTCLGGSESTTGGRSTTLNGSAIDADPELYTDTKCLWFEDPTAADDFGSVWRNSTGNDLTLTELWAESDQTVTFMLQVDDGTPADIDSVDLAPAGGEAEDTSLDGDTTLAQSEELDLAITSVANTPTWVSICWTFTWND